MSASPSQPTNSAKRPLEDASSPSRGTGQPDAKRPALDKVVKSEQEVELPGEVEPATQSAEADQTPTEKSNGVKPEASDSVATGDAAELKADATSGAASSAQAPPTNTNDETAWIHIRAVISSPEAATIIGKGGENVSNIRKMSNAKCTVSDYQKGAVERILTVSGGVDAVAKVSWYLPAVLVTYECD
jgi:heterogeneous nuclear rnp K-like protein